MTTRSPVPPAPEVLTCLVLRDDHGDWRATVMYSEAGEFFARTQYGIVGHFWPPSGRPAMATFLAGLGEDYLVDKCTYHASLPGGKTLERIRIVTRAVREFLPLLRVALAAPAPRPLPRGTA